MQRGLLPAGLLVLVFGLAGPAQGAGEGVQDGSWYAGGGPGLSRLEPETDGSVYALDGSRSNGWKIYAGYDLLPQLAVELFYAELGEARIDPDGTIGYKDMGASALLYLFQQDQGRAGWSVFGRVGMGRMSNDTDLDYERLNDGHLMVGLGVEKGLGNGLAVRADLDLYDADAQMVSLTVLKRFGARREARAAASPSVAPVPAAPAPPEPPPAEPVAAEPPVPVEPIVAVPVEPAPPPVTDHDADGVLDTGDACPDTVAGAPVDGAGCELPQLMVLKGVSFATNSATLARQSGPVLDEAVANLLRNPHMRVEVAGHTDSAGSLAVNKRLSQRRAESVRDYLVSRGVAADRLQARGYGPEAPIADNKSAAGRALNRRVELRVMK